MKPVHYCRPQRLSGREIGHAPAVFLIATPAVRSQRDWWSHRKPVNFIKTVAASVCDFTSADPVSTQRYRVTDTHMPPVARGLSGSLDTWEKNRCSSNGFHTSTHAHAYCHGLHTWTHMYNHACEQTESNHHFLCKNLKSEPFLQNTPLRVGVTWFFTSWDPVSVSLFFFEYAMCSVFTFPTLQVLHRFLGDFMSSLGLVKRDPGSNGSFSPTSCSNVNVLKWGWGFNTQLKGTSSVWLKSGSFFTVQPGKLALPQK